MFIIEKEEWDKNKEECKELVKKYPQMISKKTTKGNFTGDYINWLNVWKWMKKKYPNFVFNVVDIKMNETISGYVIAELIINNQAMGKLSLTLETFKKANGEFFNETPEQLQMRVFVKLVANITGFGIHLWEK